MRWMLKILERIVGTYAPPEMAASDARINEVNRLRNETVLAGERAREAIRCRRHQDATFEELVAIIEGGGDNGAFH